MIFVSVGTFVRGFDELIEAMDNFCAVSGQAAFAQIGNSSIVPQHMHYENFLSAAAMQERMREADVIVCHAGFGVLGEAMRCNKPIVAIPRQNLSNTANAPANNQLEVALRLESMYGVAVCRDLRNLNSSVETALALAPTFSSYVLGCNIPNIIKNYLQHSF